MITNPIMPSPPPGPSRNPGVAFLQKALPAAISLAFIVGAVIFFFVLIMGAIQWISSGGDKQAVENARGKITSAIIGLVILFAVYAIIQLLNSFFNVQLLNLNLPRLIGS
jgi:NADH:ubiquinone oxidoreductase subunit 6 (subunit J)